MPAGGYLLVGEMSYPGLPPASPNRYLYFVRTTATGDTLWTKRMAPPRAVKPTPTGMVVDPAGNIIVSGYDAQNKCGFVSAFTPLADTIWNRRFYPATTANSSAICVPPMLTADGNYAVLQYTTSYNGTLFECEPYLVKVNVATGNVLWRNYLSAVFQQNGYSPFYLYVTSVVKTANGYLAFAQCTNAGGMNSQPAILALDENGNSLRFKSRVDGQLNSPPVAYSTTDGNVVVGRRQMATKLTPLGDTLWHTAVPQRLNRYWDAAALCEDAQAITW